MVSGPCALTSALVIPLLTPLLLKRARRPCTYSFTEMAMPLFLLFDAVSDIQRVLWPGKTLHADVPVKKRKGDYFDLHPWS